MTKREIFVVAIKIFGIYLWVRALWLLAVTFPFLVPLLTQEFERKILYLLVGLVQLSLYIGGAFCLIKWAEPIAAKLSGKEEPSEVKAVV